MKQKTEIRELREMGAEALTEKLLSLEEELMKLRFRHASGQLENTARLELVRRSIARVKTVQFAQRQAA